MNKLPVFRVAGRAIGFTLWNCWTIFRLGWLPLAALFAAQIGLSAYIMHLDGEQLRALPSPFAVSFVLQKAIMLNIALMVLEAIAIAAVAVSIHRVILFGERRPGQFFNFGFGKTEFLYIVMGFLTAVLMIGLLAIFVSTFAFVASGGDPVGVFKKFADNPEAAAQLITGSLRNGGFGVFMAAYFAFWVIMIYVSIRLAVWPPAVVATNRLSPSEPWSLTHGNVWRFIGAFILTFGWIYLLVLVPLAAGSYWYYKNKMTPPADVPAITAPASPEAKVDAPVMPMPKDQADKAPAPSAAAPVQAPQPTAPVPAPVAPPATIPSPVPPAPEVEELDDEGPDPDEARRQVESMFGPFAAAIWIGSLFAYIYFTALAVALMSFSYKALKGYEAHEPIPEG